MNPSDDTWPVIDRHRRHIRTPDGWTVIPFHVIHTLACLTVVLLGVEATFGITNWITIPTVIAALLWAVERCDHAAITHRHTDHQDQP